MIEDNQTAARAIITLCKTANEDDMLNALISEAATKLSIVEQVRDTVEAIYAYREVASANTMLVAADLALFASMNGWSRFRDVGPRMARALLRDAMGEKTPSPKSDPDVHHRFKQEEPAPTGDAGE